MNKQERQLLDKLQTSLQPSNPLIYTKYGLLQSLLSVYNRINRSVEVVSQSKTADTCVIEVNYEVLAEPIVYTGMLGDDFESPCPEIIRKTEFLELKYFTSVVLDTTNSDSKYLSKESVERFINGEEDKIAQAVSSAIRQFCKYMNQTLIKAFKDKAVMYDETHEALAFSDYDNLVPSEDIIDLLDTMFCNQDIPSRRQMIVGGGLLNNYARVNKTEDFIMFFSSNMGIKEEDWLVYPEGGLQLVSYESDTTLTIPFQDGEYVVPFSVDIEIKYNETTEDYTIELSKRFDLLPLHINQDAVNSMLVVQPLIN